MPEEIKEENINKEGKEIKKIGDVLPKPEPLYPELEQVEVANVLNKELVIEEINFLPSSYKSGEEFVVAKISLDGATKKISIGSVPVVQKLKKIEDKLPVSATIIQKKGVESGRKYFDLE